MKKKISMMLVATMALTMVLGMNVFAAGSSTTTETARPTEEVTTAQSYANVTASNDVVINGVATSAKVTIAPVSVAEVQNAEKQAVEKVGAAAKVLQMVNVTIDTKFDKVQLTFDVPSVTAGQAIAVLHQLGNGSWEVITPDKVDNGKVTATFTSLSPVAFVAYAAAPQTGATVPVVMLMALICLAGAGVCATKVRLNK